MSTYSQPHHKLRCDAVTDLEPLGKRANQLLKVQDVQARDAVASNVTAVPTDALIAAGAECFVAFSGENHDADRA